MSPTTKLSLVLLVCYCLNSVVAIHINSLMKLQGKETVTDVVNTATPAIGVEIEYVGYQVVCDRGGPDAPGAPRIGSAGNCFPNGDILAKTADDQKIGPGETVNLFEVTFDMGVTYSNTLELVGGPAVAKIAAQKEMQKAMAAWLTAVDGTVAAETYASFSAKSAMFAASVANPYSHVVRLADVITKFNHDFATGGNAKFTLTARAPDALKTLYILRAAQRGSMIPNQQANFGMQLSLLPNLVDHFGDCKVSLNPSLTVPCHSLFKKISNGIQAWLHGQAQLAARETNAELKAYMTLVRWYYHIRAFITSFNLDTVATKNAFGLLPKVRLNELFRELAQANREAIIDWATNNGGDAKKTAICEGAFATDLLTDVDNLDVDVLNSMLVEACKDELGTHDNAFKMAGAAVTSAPKPVAPFAIANNLAILMETRSHSKIDKTYKCRYTGLLSKSWGCYDGNDSVNEIRAFNGLGNDA